MALARSRIAHKKFVDKYKQIADQRDIFVGIAVSLDFVSVLSTSLAVVDSAQILGFSLSVFLTVSVASLTFYGLILGAIICGIVCATDVVSERGKENNDELNLMRECFNLKLDRFHKEEKIKNVLEDLLAVQDDEFIRARYNKILEHDDVEKAVLEIKGYIKTQKHQLFPMLVREQLEKPPALPLLKTDPPNYTKRNLISFCTGAGFMLGVVATIIGASPLGALLFTPAVVWIVPVALVFIVAAGLAQLWLDIKIRKIQKENVDKYEAKKFERTLTNKRFDKTALAIEDYKIMLSQKKYIDQSRARQQAVQGPESSFGSSLRGAVIARSVLCDAATQNLIEPKQFSDEAAVQTESPGLLRSQAPSQ